MIENQSAAKPQLANGILRWLDSENRFCSSILDEKVTNRETILAANTLITLFAIIGFAETNLPLCVALTAWFTTSVLALTKGGRV